jgi:hypothetical protein
MWNVKFKDGWKGKAKLRDAALIYFFIGNISVFITLVLAKRLHWKIVKDTQFVETGYWVQNSLFAIFVAFFLITLKILWSCSKNCTIVFATLFVRFAILVCVTFLLGSAVYDYAGSKGYLVKEVTITGKISPSLFVELTQIVQKSWITPSKLIISSGGGNMESAVAIGRLIKSLNMDVEVRGICASACANYIFPSGNYKYLGEGALVIYHGSFRQKNLVGKTKVDTPREDSDCTVSTQGVNGIEGKEVVILAGVANEAKSKELVRNYIGIPLDVSVEELIVRMGDLETKFYDDLHIDPNIATYGQEGNYLEIYKSYKYTGFYYSLDTLKKMGVANVVPINGQWNPQKNAEFPYVYEVQLESGSFK